MPSLYEDQPEKWILLPASWREAAFQQHGAILLESSRQSKTQRHSLLFTDAHRILTASSPHDLPLLFEQIEAALAEGCWVAGYLSYEAGSHFVDLPSGSFTEPVAIFGVYDAPRIFDHTCDTSEEPEIEQPDLLPIAPMLRIRREDYTAAITRIQQWIAAGETYQLNFTTHATSPYGGTPASLYDALRIQQPCSYGGILRLHPGQTILSISPELFFRAEADGTLTTKPMKGTAKRGATPEQDEKLSEALHKDEKNRAEHVMIVDLLRNDLGRICQAGSVRVDRLFEVERYPTLLQMTSTIRGRMPLATPWYDVLRALFPSGSITGAPKRHTMELIAKVEERPRGVYTGSLGYFAPDRSACFNVAIRTVVLQGQRMELGVGGGIVADSTAHGEYDECLLKTAFLHRAAQSVEIVETMRATDSHVVLLDRHLQRLMSSAAALGFPVAEQQARTALQAALTSKTGTQRVRLLLERNGVCTVQIADAPAWPAELRIRLASGRLHSDAPHLRHKTTFRPEYAPELEATHAAGLDESIFENERGELADACISSLLVCMNGTWYTPSIGSGCLPGVYRGALLDAGLLHERTITRKDLKAAEHLCLCNAVRGIGSVASLQLTDAQSIRYTIAASPPRLPAW